MILYRKGASLRVLVRFSGSVLPSAALVATYSAVVAVLLQIYVPEKSLDKIFDDPYPFQPVAHIVGVAIVFATNVAYLRYWESCSSVTYMSARWGDAVATALSFDELRRGGEPADPVERRAAWRERRLSQASILHLASLLHGLALLYLRRDSQGDVASLMHADSADYPDADVEHESGQDETSPPPPPHPSPPPSPPALRPASPPPPLESAREEPLPPASPSPSSAPAEDTPASLPAAAAAVLSARWMQGEGGRGDARAKEGPRPPVAGVPAPSSPPPSSSPPPPSSRLPRWAFAHAAGEDVRATQRLCAASFGERVRMAEAAAAGCVARAQPRDSAALDSAAGPAPLVLAAPACGGASPLPSLPPLRWEGAARAAATGSDAPFVPCRSPASGVGETLPFPSSLPAGASPRGPPPRPRPRRSLSSPRPSSTSLPVLGGFGQHESSTCSAPRL